MTLSDLYAWAELAGRDTARIELSRNAVRRMRRAEMLGPNWRALDAVWCPRPGMTAAIYGIPVVMVEYCEPALRLIPRRDPCVWGASV